LLELSAFSSFVRLHSVSSTVFHQLDISFIRSVAECQLGCDVSSGAICQLSCHLLTFLSA